MLSSSFEGDLAKDLLNQKKHGVSFSEAQNALLEKHRVLQEDVKHFTAKELRYFYFGKHDDGILTARFTYRGDVIRVVGAGYWTKGEQVHEQANQVQQKPNRCSKDH
jgi:uncharacterized protein